MILHTERHGSGERLVLVHGFTQTGRSWLPVVERLADRYEVLLVDAPGHGGSSDVSCGLWRAADLLVAAGGEATYVGYSMGARLVLHAALAHPLQVQRCALLSATPGIGDDGERAERRASDELLAESLERDGLEIFLERWMKNPLFAHLPAGAAAIDDRMRNRAGALAASLRLSGTGTQDNLWPRLGELKMPVLVMAGVLDARFARTATEMEASIGPRATLRLIEGTGHSAHLERPGAFAELLGNWLDRTSSL